MKKYLVLLLLIAAFAGKGFAQTNADKLLGYWTSTGTSTAIVFYHDTQGDLKAICWDKTDGEVLQITNLTISDAGAVNFDMYTASTKWKINSTYSLAPDGTMVESVTNPDGKTTLLWTRE